MIIGNPITPDVVKIDPRYQDKVITTHLLSQFTLESKTAYDNEALTKVNGIKTEYGGGVSTLVRIYNATGMELQYVTDHDWEGHIWKYSYDGVIENGQWSVFLHVHKEPHLWGSKASLILRAETAHQDVFFGWQSPTSVFYGNVVYVESREKDHWPTKGSWSFMSDKFANGGHSAKDTWGSLNVSAQIGDSYSPMCTFVVSHS